MKNRGCLLLYDVGLKQGLNLWRPRAQHLMALPITKCKAVLALPSDNCRRLAKCQDVLQIISIS
jgi:hypothetical protein